MKNLIKELNKEVANLGVLYVKLHAYHWNVSGKQFKNLHELFEEYYNEVTEQLDEVAERVLQLEGYPLATLKEYLEVTTLNEATTKENTEEMIKEILNNFEQLNNEFKEIIKLAQELEDEVTADIFIGFQKTYQKNIWMLKATLK